MKKSTLTLILFLFSASVYQVAGSTEKMESSLNHTVVLNGTDRLINPAGSLFFKQTYAAVQKKQWTALTEAEYQRLLKYSKGRSVAVKTYGHKTFNQVIRYTRNIKVMENDSLSSSYKEITTILKKYE